MRHWEREVLLILEEEIGSLQHGRMPQLPDEFYEAFLRFGRDTYPFFEIEAQDAVVVEEAVYLPPPEECALWLRVYLHELAESALMWEGRAPYCYPPEPPDTARHRIAQLFERIHAPKS